MARPVCIFTRSAPGRSGRALAGRTRMTRSTYHLVAVAFALLFAGCAYRSPSNGVTGSEDRPAGAHFSKSQAIEIGKRAAERFGAKLTEYAEPTASYRPGNPQLFSFMVVEGPGEPPPGDHVWVVGFGWGRHSNYPGGDLTVYVDDKTGRARLAPSM